MSDLLPSNLNEWLIVSLLMIMGIWVIVMFLEAALGDDDNG